MNTIFNVLFCIISMTYCINAVIFAVYLDDSKLYKWVKILWITSIIIMTLGIIFIYNLEF